MSIEHIYLQLRSDIQLNQPLPKGSENLIQFLKKGGNLSDFILEEFAKGQKIDFLLIRRMLRRLILSQAFEHQSNHAQELESWVQHQENIPQEPKTTLLQKFLLKIDSLLGLGREVQIFNYFKSSQENTLAKISQEEILDLLNTMPVLHALSLPQRKELSRQAIVLFAPKGLHLIRKGQNSRDLFLLKKGRVGIYSDNCLNQPSQPSQPNDTSSAKVSALILQLEPGAMFGEGGFFFNEARRADVVALEDSIVIRLRPSAKLNSPTPSSEAPNEYTQAIQRKIWASSCLSQSASFKGLPTEILFAIINHGEIISFYPGHVLMSEGQIAEALWICLQGQAEVRVQGKLREPLIQAGDVVGEIGLIWNTLRTATVTVTQQSLFLRLDRGSFQSILSKQILLGVRLQDMGHQRRTQDFTLADGADDDANPQTSSSAFTNAERNLPRQDTQDRRIDS